MKPGKATSENWQALGSNLVIFFAIELMDLEADGFRS
jgi:hypothetical protein